MHDHFPGVDGDEGVGVGDTVKHSDHDFSLDHVKQRCKKTEQHKIQNDSSQKFNITNVHSIN